MTAEATVLVRSYLGLRCRRAFANLLLAAPAAPAAISTTEAASTAGTARAGAAPTQLPSHERRYFSVSAKGNTGALATKSGSRAGLLRAGTLLLNDPPPDYELSLHRGLKVQASLVLQRMPLVYNEPQHEREFRLYKEEWEQKTSNTITLDDEITYMQLPGHFLETQQQQQEREQQQQKTGDAQLSELDMLLQQQGLTLNRHRRTRQKQQQQGVTVSPTLVLQHKYLQIHAVLAKGAAATAGQREEQSLTQNPERVLLLLVKYGDGWQLPVEDRRHGQSMRQTVARLCMQQLGLLVAPFMVGFSPAAVRHIRNKPNGAIQGREVFYYRAYHVPGQPQVSPPPDSPVRDWAWVTAEEAKRRMLPNAFTAIRDSLLLG